MPARGAEVVREVLGWNVALGRELGSLVIDLPTVLAQVRVAVDGLGSVPDRLDDVHAAMHEMIPRLDRVAEVLEATLPELDATVTRELAGFQARLGAIEHRVAEVDTALGVVVAAIPGARRRQRNAAGNGATPADSAVPGGGVTDDGTVP